MRIGICLPMFKFIDSKFVDSLLNFLKENLPKYNIDIINRIGGSLDVARNELVKRALLNKCDYILFLDSDHIFPQGTLTRLLKVMKEKNAMIVSALYFTRQSLVIPVIRKLEGKIFTPIFNYSGIIEVDGVGMGCCLIKSEVFSKIDFPYFEFKHENIYGYIHYISEDLTFCKKVRKVGIKIYVDTDLVIKHIGGITDESDFNKKNYLYAEQLKKELIQDLSEFDKINKDNVLLNLIYGTEKFKDEWEKKPPKSKRERDNLYKNSFYSKYDLANWHLGSRINFNNSLVEMIKKKYPNKHNISILDYGCGIGQNSYLLRKEGYIDITLYDLNLKFAEFRFKKHKLNFYSLDLNQKYDIILCFDVLEHLDDKEFEQTTKLFKKLIKPNGEILATVSFGNANGLHPMHFEGNEKKFKMLKEILKNARIR